MTTFAESHVGDTIHLRGVLVRLLAHDKTWALPLTLITDPAPCGDPGCAALRCEALTPEGHHVYLHRRGDREIDVLEPAPLAAHGGDDLAESVSKPTVRGGDPIGDEAEQDYELSRADYDTAPNDEGDNA
ncbi:hypothetical protein [Streptomyces sp.]|uniref:hypothetical protein n=1 Tax=Streptomyces sp. TaxID=1931 RepID=UPI002F91C6FB